MYKNVLCGVYCITNTANGFRYIGSAQNIKQRWNTHRSKLNMNTHENEFLQRSWNKYGESAFIFTVIEDCGKEELGEKEDFYILFFNTLSPNGYNMKP